MRKRFSVQEWTSAQALPWIAVFSMSAAKLKK